MWLSTKNSTSIQTSIFSLRCTSCHFLFNISSPIHLLKSTASNFFLLSSTLFPSTVKSSSYLTALFCLWFLYYKSLFSCPSSNQKLCPPSQLFHLIWLHCSWLCWVEISFWKSSPFDDPCVMELLLSASTSTITHTWKTWIFLNDSAYPSPISHHVDNFKDGKLNCPSDELPIHEHLSYSFPISRLVFFIFSVPLVLFLTQRSVPVPFFISGKSFSIWWKVKLTCSWSEGILVSSLFMFMLFLPTLIPCFDMAL